jgi:hypothetical protein
MSDSVTVFPVLVSERVELMGFVIHGQLAAGKLGVESNKVGCLDRLANQRQFLVEVL